MPPASPSKIPKYSPAGQAQAAAGLMTISSSPTKDAVRQVLEELISSVACSQQCSAITALREGIDARCGEPSSIEAMEACSSGQDDTSLLRVPLPATTIQHRRQQKLGAALQESGRLSCNTNFAADFLGVEGPAESWLRCSGDFTATTAAAAVCDDTVTEADDHKLQLTPGATAARQRTAGANLSAKHSRHGSLGASACSSPRLGAHAVKAVPLPRSPGRAAVVAGTKIPVTQHQHSRRLGSSSLSSSAAASPKGGAGLDVAPGASCRRSSGGMGSSSSGGVGSSCSSSCSGKRASGGGGAAAAVKDEAAAAWMSSLRSGAVAYSSPRQTVRRTQSSSSTVSRPVSSSKQLGSTQSARLHAQSSSGTAGAAAARTPTAITRASTRTGLTPRSQAVAEIGSTSGSRRAQLSLRSSRSGSLSSALASPRLAAPRSSSKSQQGAAAATPAAALPDAQARSGGSSSKAGAGQVGPDNWLSSPAEPDPFSAVSGAFESTASAGALSGSGQGVATDPTAVRLFMELDQEIEAEGRAAMAAAATAAGASAAGAVQSQTRAVMYAGQLSGSRRGVTTDLTAEQLFVELNQEIEAEGKAAMAAAAAAAGASAAGAVQPQTNSTTARESAAAATATADVQRPAAVAQSPKQWPLGVAGDVGAEAAESGAAGVSAWGSGAPAESPEAGAMTEAAANRSEADGCCVQAGQAGEAPAATAGGAGAVAKQQALVEAEPEEQPSCGCRCVIM